MFRLGGGDEWKYGSCFNGFMLVFGCWLVGCSVLVEMAGHQSKRTDGSMFCLSIQHEWMGYDEATEQQRKNCIVKHWLLTDAYGKSPKTSWNLAGTIDWYRKVNAWWRWHCSLYSPRFPPRFARYSELLVLFLFHYFCCCCYYYSFRLSIANSLNRSIRSWIANWSVCQRGRERMNTDTNVNIFTYMNVVWMMLLRKLYFCHVILIVIDGLVWYLFKIAKCVYMNLYGKKASS